jgi:hypothetical protein
MRSWNHPDAWKNRATREQLRISRNRAYIRLCGAPHNRINWLFLGSDKGGQTAAVLFSFTATCKDLGIDTFAYLRDVLERLPTHPPDRLEELLPHQWQAAKSARKATSSASKDADSKDS